MNLLRSEDKEGYTRYRILCLKSAKKGWKEGTYAENIPVEKQNEVEFTVSGRRGYFRVEQG